MSKIVNLMYIVFNILVDKSSTTKLHPEVVNLGQTYYLGPFCATSIKRWFFQLRKESASIYAAE